MGVVVFQCNKSSFLSSSKSSHNIWMICFHLFHLLFILLSVQLSQFSQLCGHLTCVPLERHVYFEYQCPY